MATAFLSKGEKVLMIKKAKSRLFPSEFWSGLGGHLEPQEIHSPMAACLREIREESGIEASEVSDLKLRYILIRMKEDEIRQQFVYFGTTTTEELKESDEGELHWIDQSELLTLNLSRIVRSMLEHFISSSNDQEPAVGVITVNGEQEPIMSWTKLKDPNVF